MSLKQKSKHLLIIFFYLVKHPKRFYDALTVRGKKWAMRGFITFLIILVAVPSAFWYQARHAKAAWWDQSWTYRQKIQLTNSTGADLTDFQVSTTVDTASLISDGKMQGTCADMRFTDSSGQVLPYWIEENNPGCNNSATKVWIRVPTVNAGTNATSIYMYYGNSSAAATQSGDDTFEFFDDFNGSSIDGSKWDQVIEGDSGTISETGGAAVLAPTDATVSSASLRSKATFTNNEVFEVRRKQATNSNYMDFSLGAGSVVDENGSNSNWWHTTLQSGYYWFYQQGGPSGIYSMPSSGAKSGISTQGFSTDTSNYSVHKFTYGPSGELDWSIDGASEESGTDNTFLGDAKKILLTQGEYASGAGDTQFLDWIDVHKYASADPTSSANAEETQFSTNPLDPVAYWKFDEGQGGTAHDATANHNDGTLHGNAAWKPESDCISGKCLYYDGDYDSVSAGHDSSIEMGTADMTISAWVRINSSQTGYAGIVTKGAAGDADEGYELSYDVSEGGLFFWVSNGTIRSTSYSSGGLGLNDDKWHHIELVAKRNDREHYYVDGKDVGYQAATHNLSDFNGQDITNSGEDLYIGEWADGNSFKGFIDEVKIYKYARSADQIKLDYNAGQAGIASNQGAAAAVGQSPKWMTDGLVGHWNMDESSGTNVADSSGNGNDGTLTNAQETGTSDASGNSTTTMKDTDGSLSTTDNAYNNMILHFNGACGSITDGTERTIQDYTGASKTFTVATLPSNPDSCSYEIRHQTEGKFGNGLGFDGTDDYVSGSLSNNIANSSFTISGWIYQNSDAFTSWFSLGSNVAGTDKLIHLRIMSGTMRFGFYSDDLDTAPGTFTSGSWHHVVYTYDKNSRARYIYLDGSPKAHDIANSDFIGDNHFLIGANYPGSPSEFWNGKIDDTRIYNRALSPDEVQQLSQWAPGPVGWWKMDDHVKGDGQTLVDSSGNGYNLGTSWGDNGSGMDCTVPGKYGGGCQLDGVDDAMGTSDDHFKLRDAMTIEAWVKPPSNPVLDGGIITQGGSYEMRVHQSTDTQFQTFIYIGGSVYDPNGYTTLDKNTWQHIALTYDKYSRQLIAYKNGVVTGARTLSGLDHYEMDASTDPLLLGEYNANFNGVLDDVRVYNYARTPSQVTEDMVGDSSSSSGGNGAVGSPMFELKYDEGTGTVAHDSGVNKDDGNLVDGASWDNSGKFGRAVKLDGLNDRVQTSTSAPYEYQGGDMTISTWFKPDASDTDTGRIISKPWNSSGDYNYMLWLEANNKIGVSLQTNLGTVTFDSNASISDGAWHYIALSLNGTTKTANLYIDGNLDTAYSTSGIDWSPPNGNEDMPLTIGSLFPYDPGWSGVTSWSVKGSIDETKVYQAALSSDQIKQDMNGGASLQLGAQVSATGATGQAADYCVPGDTTSCSGPVGEWKFDEKTGDTVHDTSGNGYDGTIWGASQRWGRGQFGSAVDFNDGQDDNAMAVADGNQWDFAEKNITVQFWMNARTAQSGTYPNLIDHYDGTNGWSAGIDSSNGSLSFIHGDGSATPSLILFDANDFRDNKWHFVSVTLNNSTQDGKMYVDGKFAGEDGFSGLTDANGSLLIGGKSNSIFQFDGLIDQAQIFNYVRTPAQISWDYNRGKPVGWWKFDEGQGTQAFDFSGNGSTGTLTNMDPPTDWVDGKFGKALDFNGSSEFVNMQDPPVLDYFNQITLSAWINTNSIGTDQSIISKYSFEEAGSEDFELALVGGEYQAQMRFDNSTAATLAGGTVSSGWHYVSAVYDGSNIYLFVDGIQVDSTPASGAIDGTDKSSENEVRVGVRESSSGPILDRFFNGQIDDVRVYNYAMTQTQVQQVMNNGAQIRFGNQ